MPGGWSSDYDDEDPEQARRLQRAVDNGVRLTVRLLELIRTGLADPSGFKLTPAILCELNGLAVDGLVDNPGKFRQGEVELLGSLHVPPPWQEVPGQIDKLCSFVEIRRGKRPVHVAEAIYLAAFTLWFVNWAHPFEDGNGRTARAAAYLILSQGLRQELPGELTLIERLVLRKRDYWRCLDAADKSWKNGQGVLDVAEMAALLRELLEAQLTDA